MAHRILGLDLGRREIKIAVMEKALRQTTLLRVDREPTLPTEDDPDGRRGALSRLLSRVAQPDDMIAVGISGEETLQRVLEFPFSDDKSLREAVGFELESHIPWDLEDVIVDYLIVGQRDEMTRVLAVAARRETVGEALDLLRDCGLEPKRLGLAAVSYAALIRAMPEATDGTTLLLDIGASGTDAAFVEDGQLRLLRTLSTGSDDVRALFEACFDTSDADGDVLASHGLLLPPGLQADGLDEQTLHDATAASLMPILREVRQTLAVYGKGGRPRPDRLVITGGLSRLRGMVEYLEGVLQLPVLTVDASTLPGSEVPDGEVAGDLCALALAHCLHHADARADEVVDFRQEEFEYEGDYRVLRSRIPQMVAFAIVALCLLALSATVKYRSLSDEKARQTAALAALSEEVVGKRITSVDKLRREFSREVKFDLASYYPDISAFRALDDITEVLHKVTEPPEYSGDVPDSDGATRPPGPPTVAPPQPAFQPPTHTGIAVGPGTPIRGLPQLGQLPGSRVARARKAFERPIGKRGTVTAPTAAPTGTPADEREAKVLAAMGKAGAAGDPGAADAPGADEGAGDKDASAKGGDPDAKPAPPPPKGHQVELKSVVIERAKVTMRGDVETQDALLAFQQALDDHRCFDKVKSSSDRITFERHRDWFKFNITFELDCPAAGASTKKPGKADEKAEDKGDGEGDNEEDAS